MAYSIKVLSDDEFEKLPYKYMDIALGVADPKTSTAYVRYSQHPELQKYLIEHEFEHLIEDHPTDEIDGVRYKIPLGAIASGIGSVAKAAVPAIGRVISAPFSGAANLIGRGASSVMNMFSGGGRSPGNISTNFNVPGVTTNFLSPSQLNFQRSMLPQSPLSQINQSSSATTKSGGNSILNFFTGTGGGDKLKNIAGIASLATGLMKGFPKVPESPMVNDLQAQIQSGGGPLGEAGSAKLQELLGQQYNALSQPEIDAALRQLELEQGKAEDQVRDMYRNIRPGSDPTTDSAFKKDLQEVQDQFARAKADTVATRTRDTKMAFDQQRLQQIQTSLGASNAQMQNLMQIAQLDTGRIMAQLNLDAEQARIFKETFLNLGASMLTPPNPLDQFLAQAVAS